MSGLYHSVRREGIAEPPNLLFTQNLHAAREANDLQKVFRLVKHERT
jgi:hypothetical protein